MAALPVYPGGSSPLAAAAGLPGSQTPAKGNERARLLGLAAMLPYALKKRPRASDACSDVPASKRTPVKAPPATEDVPTCETPPPRAQLLDEPPAPASAQPSSKSFGHNAVHVEPVIKARRRCVLQLARICAACLSLPHGSAALTQAAHSRARSHTCVEAVQCGEGALFSGLGTDERLGSERAAQQPQLRRFHRRLARRLCLAGAGAARARVSGEPGQQRVGRCAHCLAAHVGSRRPWLAIRAGRGDLRRALCSLARAPAGYGEMTEGSVQRLLNHLADLRARAFDAGGEAAETGACHAAP